MLYSIHHVILKLFQNHVFWHENAKNLPYTSDVTSSYIYISTASL